MPGKRGGRGRGVMRRQRVAKEAKEEDSVDEIGASTRSLGSKDDSGTGIDFSNRERFNKVLASCKHQSLDLMRMSYLVRKLLYIIPYDYYEVNQIPSVYVDDHRFERGVKYSVKTLNKSLYDYVRGVSSKVATEEDSDLERYMTEIMVENMIALCADEILMLSHYTRSCAILEDQILSNISKKELGNRTDVDTSNEKVKRALRYMYMGNDENEKINLIYFTEREKSFEMLNLLKCKIGLQRILSHGKGHDILVPSMGDIIPEYYWGYTISRVAITSMSSGLYEASRGNNFPYPLLFFTMIRSITNSVKKSYEDLLEIQSKQNVPLNIRFTTRPDILIEMTDVSLTKFYGDSGRKIHDMLNIIHEGVSAQAQEDIVHQQIREPHKIKDLQKKSEFFKKSIKTLNQVLEAIGYSKDGQITGSRNKNKALVLDTNREQHQKLKSQKNPTGLTALENRIDEMRSGKWYPANKEINQQEGARKLCEALDCHMKHIATVKTNPNILKPLEISTEQRRGAELVRDVQVDGYSRVSDDDDAINDALNAENS